MLLSTLLTANIIISILHSIKHVPQCIHMIENESADGVSLCYIRGEMILNLLSVFTTFKMFVGLHNATYLLPVLIEKTFSFTMIVMMFYLKNKYSDEDSDDECDYNNTWKDVESDDDDISV